MTVARWLILAGWMGCTSGSTPSPTTDASGDSGTEKTTSPLLTECALGEAPPRAFDSSPGGNAWGDLAGDFTVTELDDSTWTLSENWTGCDNYVFVAHFDNSADDELWASDVDDLLRVAPNNTHFFFVSDRSGRAARRAQVEQLQKRLAVGAARADRVHFVSTKLTEVEGSVGAMVNDFLAYRPSSAVDVGADRGEIPAPLPSFFGIDREQKWDSGGNTNDFVGGDPTMLMAAYLPMFYNHKAELAHQLASESATEVVLVDDTLIERVFVVTEELPADLSGFDTLEFDIAVDCRERNVFACSEWDRIARIELCVDGEKCTDRRELVRWITPYWRAGSRRWAIDASPLLGLLTGGTTSFRIEMGPSWERATVRDSRMVLRLLDRGGDRSVGAERVYTGGNFNGDYNTNHAPTSFTPPSSATRAELVVILSGHGQAQGSNCAEWCDHRHQFSVNGTELDEIRPEGRIGSLDCAPFAAQGVPPGQFGNWAPLRAYWCPGLPVEAMRFDITKHVTMGKANDLTYTVSYGADGTPPGGNISLTTYVAWFE